MFVVFCLLIICILYSVFLNSPWIHKSSQSICIRIALFCFVQIYNVTIYIYYDHQKLHKSGKESERLKYESSDGNLLILKQSNYVRVMRYPLWM